MKLKKWLYSSFLALAATFMFTHSANAASAAYGSSTVSPTIYAKNYWYTALFPIVGSPPSSSKVTTVYYTWKYASRPVGLQVALCHVGAGICIDVTNTQSGSTTVFQQYGASAASQFYLAARVNGTGTMSPVYGQSSNITVNYTY